MYKKQLFAFILLLLLLSVYRVEAFETVMMPGPPPSGRCSIWARDYEIPFQGSTYIYLWWEDVGVANYYLVLYEGYPDGTLKRFPLSGYYGPYPAPGPNRVLVGGFYGDVAGKHMLYFQVYTEWGDLICTSNTITINVVKVKKPSSITVSVSPASVERGGSVSVTGSISPGVSARVTLKIVSPDGSTTVVEVDATSTGSFSYVFSPNKVGKWSVQASWAGNEDYVGATSDWASFNVESKKYSVSVSTIPGGLPVVVDGVEYRGSMVFRWDEESYHTLFVQKALPAGENSRYVFKRWSDGDTSNSKTIVVTGSTSYQAVFELEHMVSVQTDYGDVTGVGWYSEGTQARVALKATIIQLDENTRVVFAGWTGDVKSTDSEVWIKVDKPYSLKAQWTKQYKVGVTSEYGTAVIEGGEWQNEGATASLRIDPTRTGFLVEQVFSGVKVLSGKCAVQSVDQAAGRATFTVEGPCTLKTEWTTDYTKLIIATAAIAGLAFFLAFTMRKRKPPLPTYFTSSTESPS